jgi:hypothetical protein
VVLGSKSSQVGTLVVIRFVGGEGECGGGGPGEKFVQ